MMLLNARYTVSDLMGRVYHATDDMRDAFTESVALAVELLIVRDQETGRTVYVKHGLVSLYVTPSYEADQPHNHDANKSGRVCARLNCGSAW